MYDFFLQKERVTMGCEGGRREGKGKEGREGDGGKEGRMERDGTLCNNWADPLWFCSTTPFL